MRVGAMVGDDDDDDQLMTSDMVCQGMGLSVMPMSGDDATRRARAGACVFVAGAACRRSGAMFVRFASDDGMTQSVR